MSLESSAAGVVRFMVRRAGSNRVVAEELGVGVGLVERILTGSWTNEGRFGRLSKLRPESWERVFAALDRLTPGWRT